MLEMNGQKVLHSFYETKCSYQDVNIRIFIFHSLMTVKKATHFTLKCSSLK